MTNRSDPVAKATLFLTTISFLGLGSSCTSLPEPKVTMYDFPKQATAQDVPVDLSPKESASSDGPREFEKLGLVRSKADFNTLDPKHDETLLCQNFYNKAVGDLVKRARDKGGDGVINVRSVVFMIDGTHELHEGAECADDGDTGQILVQGTAFRWKKTQAEKSSRK